MSAIPPTSPYYDRPQHPPPQPTPALLPSCPPHQRTTLASDVLEARQPAMHSPQHTKTTTPLPCCPPPQILAATGSRQLLPGNNKSDNKGLISADRNNKATLLLTIPRCTSKSYTNDLSSRKMTLQSAGKHPRPFRQGHQCQPAMVQRHHKGALFVSIYVVRGKEITAF